MTVLERIKDQIEGASIIDAEIDEEEGMQIVLSNGLTLILVGTVGLMRFSTKDLH